MLAPPPVYRHQTPSLQSTTCVRQRCAQCGAGVIRAIAPGSPQFLTLVPVNLAAAVLTSPHMPHVDDLAGVFRQAMASPEAPTHAPNIFFVVLAPVPKPWAAAPLRVPGAPLRPPSPAPSSTDAALAFLLVWNPRIPRGCEDEVTHAFHPKLFRHYGASVSSLPQSPIREHWAWVRSHSPSLPGIAAFFEAWWGLSAYQVSPTDAKWLAKITAMLLLPPATLLVYMVSDASAAQ